MTIVTNIARIACAIIAKITMDLATWYPYISDTISPKINDDANPNGSLDNIAGIFNSKRNILGMMPHPERMVDSLISNTDGVNLFSSLLN